MITCLDPESWYTLEHHCLLSGKPPRYLKLYKYVFKNEEIEIIDDENIVNFEGFMYAVVLSNRFFYLVKIAKLGAQLFHPKECVVKYKDNKMDGDIKYVETDITFKVVCELSETEFNEQIEDFKFTKELAK